MSVVFVFRTDRITLGAADATALVQRLRDEYSRQGPGEVVATRIEVALEGLGSDLRLLDSETNALAWTVYRWLDEAGVDGIPEPVLELRYAIDRESRVEMSYRTGMYLLPRHQATVLAENLRLRATGGQGEYGVEGARRVADEIELVLTGDSDGPVVLDAQGAESVWYTLNVSLGDPRSPLVAEAYSLYMAIRDTRAP